MTRRVLPVPEVLAKTEEHEKDPYLLKDAAYIKSDPNWRNKQRTLLFSTRGISGQHRHLMEDLKKMMPHHKLESKFEKREDFSVVNEVAELKSCNNVLFFEARGKRQDLYLHVARVPHGPTVKFQVLNVHTSGEVRLSGNCLQFSRALLTFDAPFDTVPHLQLIKELFTQSLGAPRNHPKSKPFHDHALSFFYADKKIWVRHYQIAPLTDADGNDPEKQTLTEIGPRFVLDPIWILQGSFSGKKIFHNEAFMTPTAARREAKQSLGVQAKLRAEQTEQTKQMHQMLKRSADPTDAIFEDME
ncbi:unnamed protein product [Amoebophrya sp. A25]|nr:unnamed protein product [Amoebophrya sp. A25]|eukprot:GSA25T00022852001.1